MKDVFKLAFSDFVVCTFSSNVCRLVYELRMAIRPFISGLYEVITVDMDYFFMYGNDIGKYKIHALKTINRLRIILADF